MLIQPLLNIAEICAQKEVNTVVLSPGSRCAHLTLAFVRHTDIQTYTIPDERSAAFIALGMAQQEASHQAKETTTSPLPLTALLCTSGTAALNYSPAIAEAFFQNIPLIVFTADRPPEWVNQQDGQTIHQQAVFQKHIKGSYQTPVDFSHPDAQWHITRVVNEAINLARQKPCGPVHINVPIREPFYPSQEEKVVFDKHVKLIEFVDHQPHWDAETWQQILNEWDDFEKKLIVVGQDYLQPDLLKVLTNLSQDYQIPIVTDIISNAQGLPNSIRYQDTFLTNLSEEEVESLRPDLLLTFGKSLISKPLKLFLRKCQFTHHWHIERNSQVPDTFQLLSKVIHSEATPFFEKLFEDLDFRNLLEGEQEDESGYYATWQKQNQQAEQFIGSYPQHPTKLTEWEVIREVMQVLPNSSLSHLANSMTVRYANLFGLPTNGATRFQEMVEVFANRGTSGIDGSNSTAFGAALRSPDKLVILITGDLAFFYDRNAFWNNYLPSNLRIILLNNHAGGIFRIIPGSRDQPELEEYFETHQALTAHHLAQEFGFEYHLVQELNDLKIVFNDFFEKSLTPKILEIETDSKTNAEFLDKFKADFYTFRSKRNLG